MVKYGKPWPETYVFDGKKYWFDSCWHDPKDAKRRKQLKKDQGRLARIQTSSVLRKSRPAGRGQVFGYHAVYHREKH